MLALLQRVKRASVTVDGKVVGEVDRGLLVFVGVVKGDAENDASVLANKVANLRIFEDENSKMNLSVKDAGGSVLVVSQFTLAANCKKGRRPSFDNAAPPVEAGKLCTAFATEIKNHDIPVATGKFAAHMDVELVNDGPVTIWLDSKSL